MMNGALAQRLGKRHKPLRLAWIVPAEGLGFDRQALAYPNQA
jgi:hypothetical protein